MWASGGTSGACCAAAAPPEFKSPDASGLQYGLGDAGDRFGGTSCPAGMVPMPIGADLCERAAKVAGRPYGGNITVKRDDDTSMPVGCVWYSAGGSFYFNNETYYYGYVPSSAQPVCAGAPGFYHPGPVTRLRRPCAPVRLGLHGRISMEGKYM